MLGCQGFPAAASGNRPCRAETLGELRADMRYLICRMSMRQQGKSTSCTAPTSMRSSAP